MLHHFQLPNPAIFIFSFTGSVYNIAKMLGSAETTSEEEVGTLMASSAYKDNK